MTILPTPRRSAAVVICLWLGNCPYCPGADIHSFERTAQTTVLALRGSHFTLNGRTNFLLGFSYYAALGAPEDFILKDLEDLQKHGFNWLRVWATWDAFGTNVSAVAKDGSPRKPFLGKLAWLVRECDRRGLVVDITLARNPALLPDLESHQGAVETLVQTLKDRRNWYLDLANERDVRDSRYVSPAELKRLRDRVRQIDPGRLVTASFGGHDLAREDIEAALLTIGLDFLSPHRPRGAESPQQTERQTRSALSLSRKLGRLAPIHYQEPFRRGYTDWEPKGGDFMADLRGAAGWCFHNGQQRDTPEHEPRRSFDLRFHRLMDQLDPEELKVVVAARQAL